MATALDLVNSLRAKARSRDRKKWTRCDNYDWGTYKELRRLDLNNLTRQELKNHLRARDLATTGIKTRLVERLQASVLEEQAKAHADAEDAEFELGAELEERGAVYAVGVNSSGQLGLRDLAPRERFTVLPQTRAAGVAFVAAGYDISFAVTEDHDVLSWGAKGTGATGHRLGTGSYDDDEDSYLEPRAIRDLVGEEVCQVQPGASHCLAASKGGDLYVWGCGNSGQLGLGGTETKQTPTLVPGLKHGAEVIQVAVGENHSLALTNTGELYSWGHGDRGRLGVGMSQRVGVPDTEKYIFPVPMPLHAFSRDRVSQVSCGPSFCLAITPSNVWAWGSGEGFVLGLGDNINRELPSPIEFFKGNIVLEVECGTWHCAALVLVPPCRDGGYLYTWGSGYHGQLALGARQIQKTPAKVNAFLDTQQLLKRVYCGSHHCVAMTVEGELYSWGSNTAGCLGRALPDGEQFSACPGHIGGFGVLVDGVGRGMPRAVACGKEFTIVATYPYEGPAMEVALELMRASAIEEEEIRLLEKEKRREREIADKKRAKEEANMSKLARRSRRSQNSKKPCSLCEECPGFRPTPARENICLGCHHSVSFHPKTKSAKSISPRTR